MRATAAATEAAESAAVMRGVSASTARLLALTLHISLAAGAATQSARGPWI